MTTLNILSNYLPIDVINNCVVPFLLPDKNKLLFKKREIMEQLRFNIWYIKNKQASSSGLTPYNTIYPLRKFLRISRWDDKYLIQKFKYNINYLVEVVATKDYTKYTSGKYKDCYKLIDYHCHYDPMLGDFLFIIAKEYTKVIDNTNLKLNYEDRVKRICVKEEKLFNFPWQSPERQRKPYSDNGRMDKVYPPPNTVNITPSDFYNYHYYYPNMGNFGKLYPKCPLINKKKMTTEEYYDIANNQLEDWEDYSNDIEQFKRLML